VETGIDFLGFGAPIAETLFDHCQTVKLKKSIVLSGCCVSSIRSTAQNRPFDTGGPK
jgi:hypothetical protein